MRRLTPGDPTDLEILSALAGRGDTPVFADALASSLGVAPAAVPVRLRSLVTLGYVDCLIEEQGRGDGYRLTSLGRAEVLRRTEPPPGSRPPADPAGPAAL